MPIKTLIVDNYDSFTYNIADLVAKVNHHEPVIVKNDQLTVQQLPTLCADNIILSPGPGHPECNQSFGVCKDIIAQAQIPMLGVCLGHQGIYTHFGGQIAQSSQPMHGEISEIHHQGDELFDDIPKFFKVVRYHSLLAVGKVPKELWVIAKTRDRLIMALRHKYRPIWGVQFHPESICSEYGLQLFRNFKKITENHPSPKFHFPILPQTRTLSCTIAKPPKIPLHLQIKTIHTPINLEKLYREYTKSYNQAVWLDGEYCQPAEKSFSIIGCLNGPLSCQIRYYVNRQIVEKITQTKTEISNQDIFSYLKEFLSTYELDNQQSLPFDFHGGLVGYLGYEVKQDAVMVKNQHTATHPDAQFLFLDRAVIYDNKDKTVYLLALSKRPCTEVSRWFSSLESLLKQCPADPSARIPIQKPSHANNIKCSFERTYHDYIEDIKRCLEYIARGESYEVCLTNRLLIHEKIEDHLRYFQILRHQNPAPYAALLQFNEMSIVSTSIERFLKISSSHEVETKPIKGTVPRHLIPSEDKKNKNNLANNRKTRAENLMIVDLLRNDLSQVCICNSVHVPKLMAVESYTTVHQLVTTVRGQLKPDLTAIECLKSCFPGGSMTGAPKKRTLEIIDNIEQSARGIYSGIIGYLSLNGAADFSVVIRTAVITPTTFTIGIGGAITQLSEPIAEYHEMRHKAWALLLALETYRVSQPTH